MAAIFWAWAISAAVLIILGVLLGTIIHQVPWGLLIDDRGRYSLTHLQIVVWTIVVLSLISGVFWGRVVHGVNDALSFSIPNELLIVMGISVSSTVLSIAVKSAKDSANPERVAASGALDRPRFGQVFLVEEGQQADKTLDVTKFQSFVITAILVVAYVALAIEQIKKAGAAGSVNALPAFNTTFVTLLAISHGGYIIGKVPPQAGEPDGYTVQRRRNRALPVGAPGAVAGNTFVPRNP